MKMPGAINADPDTDLLVGEKPTPCIVDQGAVRLKRMEHRQRRWLQPIDRAECVAIEFDRQDHRLAGMPHNRQGFAGPARGEDLGEKVMQSLLRDDGLRTAIRKITITAIDVAERRRLDDQQLYSGHNAARRATPGARLPVTPPVAPRVPIAPIVPVRPSPAAGTPCPVAPPIAPGEAKVAATRIHRLVRPLGNVGDRLTNGGEPFGDTRLL